jgi:hypothetical protein
MRTFVERSEPKGGSEPVLESGESIDYRLDGVELAFSAESAKEGRGELIVTSKRVLWIAAEKAYDFDVPYIILHAISRDPESYPDPCIYCQLDVDGDDEDNDGGEEDTQPSEAYFIPPSEHHLEGLFEAFSQAALKNPDQVDEDDDENAQGEQAAAAGFGGDRGVGMGMGMGMGSSSSSSRAANETSTGFFFNPDEVRLGAREAAVLDHLDSVFQEPK